MAPAAAARHPREAMPTTQQLIARRLGRIVFGGLLLAGAAYLVVALLARQGCWHHSPSLHAAQILPVTWLAALAGGALVRAIALRVPLRLAPDAWFVESAMAPAVGVALLLPLTLHMPIALLAGGSGAFDQWVVMSAVITGLAHVVFALMVARRAYQLALGRPAWSARRIVLMTTLISCVPFVLLMMIPPLLVLITALACVPLLRAMEPLIERERLEIAAAPHPLPPAFAVPRRPA